HELARLDPQGHPVQHLDRELSAREGLADVLQLDDGGAEERAHIRGPRVCRGGAAPAVWFCTTTFSPASSPAVTSAEILSRTPTVTVRVSTLPSSRITCTRASLPERRTASSGTVSTSFAAARTKKTCAVICGFRSWPGFVTSNRAL